MTWLWIAAVIAVLGAAIAFAVGRGGGMPEVAPDRPAAQVPLGALTAEDLAKVRFSQALRGYSCDEVDDLLARVSAELRRRPPVDTALWPAAPQPEPAQTNTGTPEPEHAEPVQTEPAQPERSAP